MPRDYEAMSAALASYYEERPEMAELRDAQVREHAGRRLQTDKALERTLGRLRETPARMGNDICEHGVFRAICGLCKP